MLSTASTSCMGKKSVNRALLIFKALSCFIALTHSQPRNASCLPTRTSKSRAERTSKQPTIARKMETSPKEASFQDAPAIAPTGTDSRILFSSWEEFLQKENLSYTTPLSSRATPGVAPKLQEPSSRSQILLTTPPPVSVGKQGFPDWYKAIFPPPTDPSTSS